MLTLILSIVCLILGDTSFSGALPPPYLDCNRTRDIPELLTFSAELTCPSLNDSKYICNQSRYTISPEVAKPEGYPYSEFVSFLNKRSKKILLVGDSLTGQMHLAFKCSLEGEMISQGRGSGSYIDEPAVFPYPNRFLSELQHPYRLAVHPADIHMDPMQPYVDRMFRFVLDNNYTHLVLNAGAWYSPNLFQMQRQGVWQNLTRPDESLSVFKSVFVRGGPLLTTLRDLHHNHGVTVLWRDLTPAGNCRKESKYTYHRLFPQFNSIARKAFRSIGGDSLEGIWEYALPLWRDHFGDGDSLHWCAMRPNSVPAHWNEQLMKYIYKQLK